MNQTGPDQDLKKLVDDWEAEIEWLERRACKRWDCCTQTELKVTEQLLRELKHAMGVSTHWTIHIDSEARKVTRKDAKDY